MNGSSGCDRYPLVQIGDLGNALVKQYWLDLRDAGGLIPRMPEIKEPTISDVRDLLHDQRSLSFLAFDPPANRLCAETTLTNFQGLTAMVHFSIHPSYWGKTEAVTIAQDGTRQLFCLRNAQGQYLTTLVGLTPQRNRLALRFIKKVGFKEKTVLTNAFIIANNGYEPDNGVLTQLTVEELYGRGKESVTTGVQRSWNPATAAAA